jgi:GTP cyclohydrolase I
MSGKHLCSDLLNSKNSSEEVITTFSTGVYELDFSLRNEAILNFS